MEQVASAHKVSYSGMTDFAGGASLTLGVGASSFTLNLSTKPTWTVRNLAAINGATGNTGMSAAAVTTGATSELVLTSKRQVWPIPFRSAAPARTRVLQPS